MTTNEVVVDESSARDFLVVLAANLRYFLVGRHFGFVPFFFPGLVTIVLFLLARNDRRAWQWATLCAFSLTAVGLCIYMPYTWSGGGGPPGNRYFLSIYPAVLFLTPPLASIAPAVIAWDRRFTFYGSRVDKSVRRCEAALSVRGTGPASDVAR